MIKRIAQFALQQPLFVVLGALIFIGAGIISFKNLPVEAFPDVTDNQVTIISLYSGRAAEEVERQVTMPLEVVLSGIPNAIRVFSHTQFGLSFIVVTFNDVPSGYFARQLVIERLREADLPEGVHPELAAMSSAISEIFRYRLKAAHLSPTELRTLQNWVMERQLKQVPGVADVVSFGGAIKTYEVQPNMARMRDYRISLAQLSSALEQANSNAGGGYVEHGRQQFLIRGIGLLRTAADIENVLVGEAKGVPVRVADIASVQIGDIPRQGVAGEDDDDDVVSGHILMRKGENPSVVLAAVKARIAELQRDSLPPGVEVRVFYDRSWLIERTLKTVFTNLLEGALLVCMVLYLFLGNMRAAAIVAAVIPLALLATFIGLQMVGIPANLLSLGAMDFGIIVDGAVIIVEHIFSRLTSLSTNVDRRSRLSAVLSATVEVGRPTLFSMLIIIAAHIPIFTLQRHEGRIFAPMAWSVTSALVGSLIISLTVVPLMCLWLLRGKLPHGENRIMTVLHSFYSPALQWALARRYLVLGVAAVALAASLAVVPRLGSEFLPELNEGSVWVNVAMESSVSIGEAQLMSQELRNAMRTVPEVRSTYSELGRPEDGTDPKIASQIEVLVDLYPEEQWKRKITKKQVLAELDLAVQTLPGIQVSFSQPIRDNVLESISQVDGQIVIKITGEDLDKIHEYGTQVLREIRGVQGVTRAFIDREGQLPQYRVIIDRARAARYGLRVGEIEEVIQTAMAGKIVSYLWEGERRFPVTVRLGDPARELAKISEIQVATPNGAFVPLSDVASFQLASGAMNIGRENGRRVLSVGVFIRDRDMGSVVADMRERVEKSVKLDSGYTMAWAGEFENQERAMARLAWVVPLSILIIFLFLFDAFSSLKSALLIIANIPFAMIGGIFALLITGIPLSVSAAIGFIALFGQAVLNGVVMLAYFGQLRERGATLYEAVHKGSLERLRTVLMTGLLAMLGLLPMALSTAIGSETQKPLAVVVIGGLISATFLTLFVLPTLYLWVNEGRASHAAREASGT